MKKTLYNDIRNRCKKIADDTFVFGEGNLDADIVLLGEAPGRQEAKQGSPFVGKAGQKLNEFLEELGLVRGEIYITNAIKIWPHKLNPKSNRLKTKSPTMRLMRKYRPLLLEELHLIGPQLIVTLGAWPLTALMDKKAVMKESHGRLFNLEYKAFSLYHPAATIYDPLKTEPYLKDLQKLKQCIASEINQKK